MPDFDQRIEAALARTVTVEFIETPLAEAVRMLETMVKIPIQIDGEVNAASQTSVTLKARDVSLETLLDMMLRTLPKPLELGWTIRDGGVLITARSSAENDLQLKYYPVAKLMQTLGGSEWENDELQELVSANITPSDWDDAGGLCTMRRLPNLLVVDATRNVHVQVQWFLGELERAFGLTPRRVPPIAPSLDALQRALDAETSFEFNETPLDAAAAQLAKEHGISLVLDTEAMIDARIALDSKVTANIENKKLKHALKTLLSPLDLTWVIRDDVLWITTDLHEETESRRFYRVDDLINPNRPGAIDPDELVEFVTATVKPDSWDDVGGPGVLTVLPRGVWIILQTETAHDDIELSLARLREAIRAGEDEARELPDGGNALVERKRRLRRTVYRIGGLSAEDIVKTIRGSISPDTWDANGGEGTIHPNLFTTPARLHIRLDIILKGGVAVSQAQFAEKPPPFPHVQQGSWAA
ncbi:MAG TPA: hypothetical protein VND64_08470, partial [Pirellulales bacterium]|nr:hypothetical protein [Pirellulales bacterium]